MKRLADILFFVLMGGAILQAGLLLWQQKHTTGGPVCLPLVGADGDLRQIYAPGGADALLRTRVAALGDYVTVEDLVRGALLLERGELQGAPPLTAREHKRLLEALEQAQAHRTELATLEVEIREIEAQISENAQEIAHTLTEVQRAWILEQRDRVSIDQVERQYWDQLLLEAQP